VNGVGDNMKFAVVGEGDCLGASFVSLVYLSDLVEVWDGFSFVCFCISSKLDEGIWGLLEVRFWNC
jgi:hypothetical protein